MKFAQWFFETDSPLPDARQFSYIACVLDLLSQQHLEAATKKWFFEKLGHGMPPDWTWRAHHMTVLYRKGGPLTQDLETYRQFFGQDVKLIVTGIAADDNCVAVKVRPNQNIPLQNANPHVTVAHSRSVGPEYSNTLLMNNRDVQQFEITELNSVFAAVKKDQKSIWPEKAFPLAIPVKV